MRYYTKPQNTLKWKTGRYNSEIKFNTDSIFLVDALISKTVYDYKFFNVHISIVIFSVEICNSEP